MKSYPEYKASSIDWLGEIPSHWKAYKLKYFIEISNGCDPKTDGDVPVYGTGGKPFKTCGESKPGPTVLLGRKGTIDTPHWIQEDYWNVDTAFDTKAKSGYFLRFFWYVANCLDYSKYSANTAVPSMTQSAYENMSIPVPSIEEQEAIAGYLDEVTGKIDVLISEKTAQVVELRAYRSSLITETVTRGLNPDAPLRDSGIEWLGQIPQHWDVSKLKYFIDIFSGDPIDKQEISSDGLFQVYGGGEAMGRANKFNVEPDTIIIGRVGARCGCVTRLIEKAWATDNSLICKTNQNAGYLFFLLNAANLNSLNESNAQPLITATKVKNLSVPVPPLSEQKEIADFLDEKMAKIDRLIDELTKQLDELAEYKKAVITEAVTGKVDVRDYKPNI